VKKISLDIKSDMYIIYHRKEAGMASKSHLAGERRIVSRIHWLINQPGLLRASLVRMKRKCGNKKCCCVKGKLHKSWYLYQSRNGKPRMLYVPGEWEKDVISWVERNKETRKLLDELSRIYWDKIRKREK
jgi:hypothetical protein